MKKINKILMMIIAIAYFSSCETTELDLLDSPNALPPSNISVNDGLNGLQFNFLNFFTGTSNVGSQATRMSYMFGSTYENAFGPGTGGGAWNSAYAGILSDSETILPLAIEFGAPLHEGVIRVMKSYTLMTLVDYWGDVPYTEALQGNGNFNPSLTDGATVYTAALSELNAGIDALTTAINSVDPDDTEREVPNNIPGGGDVNPFFFENATSQEALAVNWRKFANSIKFKYYLNLGDVAGMNSALNADGGVIENNADSAAFRYGNTNDPESRHGSYVGSYGANAPSTYISNSYMWAMIATFNGGGNTIGGMDDPRAQYYFYRQATSFPTNLDNPSLGDALPCSDDTSPYTNQAFCSFGNGYWGRDHGDASGIPPDGTARTALGAYPVGGNVDTGDGGAIADEDGINGEGITPVLMAWQMDLLRAEAALVYGVTGNPQTLLQSALTKQMDYVINFDEFVDETNNFTGVDGADGIDDDDPDSTQVSNYINAVVTDFGAGDLQKLGVQMWLASYFSGNEMYNFYRRTGSPNNLQPHLLLGGGGDFARSLFYPTTTADLNTSVSQKSSLTESVFWADPSIPLQ